MRKMASAALSACVWVSLLAIVAAGVVRICVEAKDKRSQHSPQIARLQDRG